MHILEGFTLDLVYETSLKEVKPVDSPIDANSILMLDQEELLSDSSHYRRLVGKFNNLIMTHPDILFAMSVVSQLLAAPDRKSVV